NLIPGFPLDGGRMLRAVIWRITGSLERATLIASRTGQVVAVAFIAAGVLRAFTGGGIAGLWLILLGWFMDTGAQGRYQQARLRTIRPTTSAYEAFARMAQDGIGRLLVTDLDGTLLGIVTRSDLLHAIRTRVELEEPSAERAPSTRTRPR